MNDVERKLRLTQFLREESSRNRMQIKKREEILTDCVGQEISDNPFTGFSFRSRVFLAVLLFLTAIYLDNTDRLLMNTSPRDWFNDKLNWSSEAKLIDFISTFPYTLSDTQ